MSFDVICLRITLKSYIKIIFTNNCKKSDGYIGKAAKIYQNQGKYD